MKYVIYDKDDIFSTYYGVNGWNEKISQCIPYINKQNIPTIRGTPYEVLKYTNKQWENIKLIDML